VGSEDPLISLYTLNDMFHKSPNRFMIGVILIPIIPLIILFLAAPLNNSGFPILTLLMVLISILCVVYILGSLYSAWDRATIVANWLEYNTNKSFYATPITILRCVGRRIEDVKQLDNYSLDILVHQLMRK
jgi:hypothetical protein